MRVIAGTARRIQLKTIPGMDTRPTTDRIKETLFNMIQSDLYDTNFLDLFSGSGGVGIEALSRGARECHFIEQNPKACSCIRDNLKATKFDNQAKVMQCDALAGLKSINGKYCFDYIFMDPPYNEDIEKKILEYIIGSELLGEDGVIIVEASLATEFNYVNQLGCEIIKDKKYKTNKHVFLKRGKRE